MKNSFTIQNSLAYYLIAFCVLFGSCITVDVFEKNVPIPGHAWSSQFKPEISFDVKDTLSKYNIYVVVRHTDAYQYNNIWVNIYTQLPGDTMKRQRLDLRLATDDKGWLGSGMDDIYEHRILIAPQQSLKRAGEYRFKLENIMREEPLLYVLDVGIRVEKAR